MIMAKKITEEKKIETSEVHVEVSQLALENDKYIGDMARFLEERIKDLKIERQGNNLVLTVPKNFSRRLVREILKKFLYLSQLDNKFRPISLQESDKGYKIYKKPTFE